MKRNQYEDAYHLALAAFRSEPDLEFRARLAGALFDKEQRAISISYCGCDYLVGVDGGIEPVSSREKPELTDEILILQYLTRSSGLPPRGQWLSFLELPGGPQHYAPFQREAISPLAREFGDDPEDFRRVVESFGGEGMDAGDVGAVIPALPKVPLALVLWAADEEFEARANILFDVTASTHLETASLYMLGIQLSKAVRKKRGFWVP